MSEWCSTTPDSPKYRVVIAQYFLEFLLLVVDHLVGAKATYQFDVVRAGGRSHLGPQVLCQLDRKRSDTAGPAGMNTF